MINSNTVIISFTGAALKMGGIQMEEFKKLKQYSFLDYKSYSDYPPSMFNNVDLKEVTDLVKGYTKIIAIGNSMGAYNAAIFSTLHPVDLVIGFAPVYSIHPDIPPYEKRWESVLKHIKEWKYKHIQLNNFTKYFFIHGDTPEELAHINLIPNQSNVVKLKIKNADHGVAGILKNNGTLYKIIDKIIYESKL